MDLLRIFLVTAVAILPYVALSTGQVEDPFAEFVEAGVLGKIRGRVGVTSRDQTPYLTFHGIPYADPASYTGGNRFKPSTVYKKSLPDDGEGFFAANRIFTYCPQEAILDLNIPGDLEEKESLTQNLSAIYGAIHKKKRLNSKFLRQFPTKKEKMRALMNDVAASGVMGQEECLIININTPRVYNDSEPTNELYPVILFIHGGGSEGVWGSAFTALRLLEEKVVYVTINYRLGVLGAFNLGVDEAPGCAGLYDAVTALEWIQTYIHYFGGDRTRVTISGQSAGSMMVTNLLISPIMKDKDWFHGVWGFSGTGISVWAVSEEPAIDNHLEIAELCDCYHPESQTPEDIPTITECMKNANHTTLVAALGAWKAGEVITGRLGYDARVPSIQAPGLSIPYFMPKHPFDTLQNLEQKDVPMVLGATRHDGSYPLEDIYHDFLEANNLHTNESYVRNEMLPFLLRTLGVVDETGELYHAMARTYLGKEESITGSLADKLPGMLDMVTIMAFKAGAFEMLKQQYNLNNKTKSYFYSFDYVGRWSLYNFLWGIDMLIPGGVCHTNELIYIFWLGPLWNEDMKVSRRFTKYFTNFAYYRDPNGDPTSSDYKEFWKPYDHMNHYFLQINRHDKLLPNAPDHWIGVAKELDWSKVSDPPSSPTVPTTTPVVGTTNNVTVTMTEPPHNDDSTTTTTTLKPPTSTAQTSSSSSPGDSGATSIVLNFFTVAVTLAILLLVQ